MAEAWTFQRGLRVGLLALSFVLTIASAFIPWWSVERRPENGETSESTASPAGVHNELGGSTEALQEATTTTSYLLLPLAFLTLVLLVIATLPRGDLRNWIPLALGICALLLAAVALLNAYFVWPGKAPPEWQVRDFEDNTKHTNQQVQQGPRQDPRLVGSSYYHLASHATWGFYIVIVAAGLAFSESSIPAMQAYFDVGRFQAPESEAPPPRPPHAPPTRRP